ncbi:hypothetical protein [Actinoplanes derwentensis]|uniref:Thioesterase-like superfamily protein n=1 Tax=Actinoplanes derwentensis TaxID=113562 RepID=A0A1H2D2Q4_9ACTN|nr:hypothetical protein [Actinoplanes derwentensis]GID89141.1 hypothetical protein Ade03nite_80650 [Actinoplanes derwentensis]SDT77025.1 hypothetical protein SAMN04489716_7806 [Actinoplanes derwentensis]
MRIPARFNGPPGTGNGGWCAGAFALAAGARTGGPAVQVTLRVPPPLETPLQWRNGSVFAAETLVAEVTEAPEAAVDVPPVPFAEAVAASRGYPGFSRHPFPTCFVCGPQREPGDGLRIFPGPLPGDRTAAPWTVPADVSVETMWAALDCPGGWSAIGSSGRAFVLGRIAAEVTALPEPGAECVVVGALSGTSGRKAVVGSTVYGPDGHRLATARATWLAVSD